MEILNSDNDDKYITLRRKEMFEVLADHPMLARDLLLHQIKDAVVIRRQDYFASPALASYASSIAIAAKLVDDDKRREELIRVADYFEHQSKLAAEEGWKTPDV